MNGASRAGINYALANRQVITHLARALFREVLPQARLSLLYDVSHNTCKEELHEVDDVNRRLFVHRKGATRAFGPGHPTVPKALRAAGRAMSRHAAFRQWKVRQVIDELAARGILIRSPFSRGVAEEASGAYKDVTEVVEAAHRAGLARMVTRLVSLICIKG